MRAKIKEEEKARLKASLEESIKKIKSRSEKREKIAK